MINDSDRASGTMTPYSAKKIAPQPATVFLAVIVRPEADEPKRRASDRKTAKTIRRNTEPIKHHPLPESTDSRYEICRLKP